MQIKDLIAFEGFKEEKMKYLEDNYFFTKDSLVNQKQRFLTFSDLHYSAISYLLYQQKLDEFYREK